MKRTTVSSSIGLLSLLGLTACCPPDSVKVTIVPPLAGTASGNTLTLAEEVHLKNVRQLTFGGDNAEAYWASTGDRLILQTNRAPYKCDQIEILSLADNTSRLVSTGKGRTTCAYFLKGDQEIKNSGLAVQWYKMTHSGNFEINAYLS